MGTKLATTAADYFPDKRTLRTVRDAAQGCKACPLWQTGTQTVFGEGPARARVMFIGEQPGNDEDLAGHPFVGPAGKLFDKALEAAGIARKDAYVTNVVKHFKWEAKGKRRLHKKPNAREIGACIPWLDAEIDLVKPELLVCLGATAAQALLGRDFRVSTQRGKLVASRFDVRTMATVHPSSILRAPSADDRARDLALFIADLKVVARLLARSGAASATRARPKSPAGQVSVSR
jgi:uracil-DNA glycosylase family protein